MTVRMLYFASFREHVGRDAESREVPDGSRVADLWADLVREVPLLRRFDRIPPAAVNRQYVPADTVVRSGDEVVFLPPVAGG